MLVKDLKLTENVANYSSLLAAQILVRNRITLQSKKTVHEDQIIKLKTSITTMHKEGFEYFKKPIACNFEQKWDKILKKVCDPLTQITLNGKKVDRSTGGSLKALPCATNM